MLVAIDSHPISPIAYTIRTAVAVTGLSRSRIYELIGQGQLEARKDGRRTLVMTKSLRTYIASLPTVRPRGANGEKPPIRMSAKPAGLQVGGGAQRKPLTSAP
jgi:excisionase family DNA binding protein